MNTLLQLTWVRAMPTPYPSISAQMVESLQGALEADAASGEMVAQCPYGIAYRRDLLIMEDTDSEDSNSDLVTDSVASRHLSATDSVSPHHPRNFSKIFCEISPATASGSNVNRIQADHGFIRTSSAEPVPSESRRLLLEPPSLPPMVRAPRAHWEAPGAAGGQQAARTASSGWFRGASSGGFAPWFARRLSMPEIRKVVRETLPINAFRRISGRIIGL